MRLAGHAQVAPPVLPPVVQEQDERQQDGNGVCKEDGYLGRDVLRRVLVAEGQGPENVAETERAGERSVTRSWIGAFGERLLWCWEGRRGASPAYMRTSAFMVTFLVWPATSWVVKPETYARETERGGDAGGETYRWPISQHISGRDLESVNWRTVLARAGRGRRKREGAAY